MAAGALAMMEPWFRELQRAYAAELPARLAAITDLAGRGELSRDDLLVVLHRLGGSAGSHGFDAVSAVAQEWERSLRGGGPAAAPDILARLRAAVEAALGTLPAA